MEILEKLENFNNLFINSKKASSSSIHSIRTYNQILEKFYEFIAAETINHKNLKLTDITRYLLNNFIIWLNDKGLSKSTQHQHINIIKQYLNFIADSDIKAYGVIKSNITGVKIKFQQKEAESFNQDEQAKIIGLIKKLDDSKNFTANRNSLILKMLLFHGIRISELISLTWNKVSEEYDENDGYIFKFTYMGKGAKERSLDFPISFISNNLEIIKQHRNSEYVVPSSTGGEMAQGNIFNTVKKLLESQGINKHGLHIFRHTFGDNSAAANINLAVISKLMGHSSTSITSKYYVRVNNKTKREAVFRGIEIFNND